MSVQHTPEPEVDKDCIKFCALMPIEEPVHIDLDLFELDVPQGFGRTTAMRLFVSVSTEGVPILQEDIKRPLSCFEDSEGHRCFVIVQTIIVVRIDDVGLIDVDHGVW